MIKKDFVYLLYETTGLSMDKAEEAMETILTEIKSSLASGESVSIVRFGRFHVLNKNPRPGRNPKTGETIIIPARKIVTFRASQKLKEAVNHQPLEES